MKKLLNCAGNERVKPPLDASHTTINNERWDRIPTAAPEADKPSLICTFEQLLAARFPKSTPQIHRYFMKTAFQFCNDVTHQHDIGYHYKTILRFENEAHKKEFEAQHSAPRRLPHVLAIGRTAYSTKSMPVDVQVHLSGLQYKREVRLGVYQNIGASLRDDVLAATSYMPSGDRAKMLLTRALICEEPLTNTVFGSVEAIGFDSTHFFKFVAKRTPDSAIGKYQRLLGVENCWYGITPQASNNDEEDNDVMHERHVESAIPIYFLVPIGYKYTGLLTSVHTYLAMQRLRKQLGYDISPELVDPSVYELPRGSADVLFAYSDLHAVVEFIDERLVNAHPTFHPFSLQLTIEPFVAESWRAVEEERFAIRNTLSSLNEHMQPADPTMGCEVELVVYYAFFEGDCAPAHSVEHYIYDDNSSSAESKYTPRRLFGTPFLTPQTSQPTTSRTKIFDSDASDTIVDGYPHSNGSLHKAPPQPVEASKSAMLREKFVAMQTRATAHGAGGDKDDEEESETTDQASSFALPNAIAKNILHSAISSTNSQSASASQNVTNSSEYEKTTIRLSGTSDELNSEFKRTLTRANQRLRSLTTGLTTSDDDNAASSPDMHALALPKTLPRSIEPDVALEKTPARKNVRAIVMDAISDETSTTENLGVFKLDK